MLKRALSVFFISSIAGSAQSIVETPDWNQKLTKDWGGNRSSLAEQGIIIEMNSVHISQYVFDGGLENELNGESIDDSGHTISTELDIKFDTDKLGLWPGGMLRIFAETRSGTPINKRAGAAASYDGLLPLVSNRSEQDVVAINELAFTQFFSEKLGIFGGLIDSALGDMNDFTGDGRSNDFFINLNFNSDPISLISTPDSALGGGIILLLNEKYSGWGGLYNSETSAGFDPFEKDEGTTFFLEITRNHTLFNKPGHQVFGVVYGTDMARVDLFADPRLIQESIVTSGDLPTTKSDTWAFYYNFQQYIQGDAEKGWGIFFRSGISDGDPNPIENTIATGIGGKGIIEGRPNDRFGIGAFWVRYSDNGLPDIYDIEDSYGFEAFYNFEILPGLHITPDLQIIESPDPLINDTTVIAGVRTNWYF